MSKEKIQEEKSEHLLSSGAFIGFMEGLVEKLDRFDSAGVERSRDYPPSYADYLELPIEDRLGAATKMLIRETPSAKRGQRDMPDNALRFDIMSNTDESLNVDSIFASIAYAEGDWTNAMNSTFIDEHSHIKVLIETTKNGHHIKSNFFRLVVGDYRYGQYSVDGVSNVNDPVFRDVVTIIDLGIGELYRDKLNRRIQKLGNIATADVS